MKTYLFLFFTSIFCLFSFFLYQKVSSKEKESVFYIASGCWGKLFDDKGDGFFNLYHLFKEKYGVEIKQAKSTKRLKNVKKLVIFEVQQHHIKHFDRYPKEKMILFLWEPPSVIPENYDKKYHRYFSKIFTWNDDLVDNKTYFKFHYPQNLSFPQKVVPFKEKKLCSLISRNKTSKHPHELYSKRKEVIVFFEQFAPQDFDLMGEGWETESFNTYKGRVPDKSCLKNYKFSFCYENICNLNGYVTEKIFDAFAAGCVPIYWGAKNITSYVPKNCFIAREDFQNNQELFYYLKNMKEETYNTYLENIKNFLQSEKVSIFSVDHFIETFEKAVDANSFSHPSQKN